MNLSIREKIFGALFGYAIGDALGLGTEFMSRSVVARRYPEGLRNYSQIVRDAHRSQWKKGEWTNDTELVRIVLDSFLSKGMFDYLDIAQRMSAWYAGNPTDLTLNLRLVLSQKDFSQHPFESTKEAWDRLGSFENTSECLGRVIFSFLSDDLLTTATDLCRLTHPRKRTIACCRIIAAMADSLFKEEKPASYEQLISIAHGYNEDVVRYVETAFYGAIEDFHLDDEDTCWFVRKAMGAALWTIWHTDSFEKGLYAVVDQGGDADTNASLAGGLLGLRYGFSSIPSNLIDNLLGKERIEEIAEKLTNILEQK